MARDGDTEEDEEVRRRLSGDDRERRKRKDSERSDDRSSSRRKHSSSSRGKKSTRGNKDRDRHRSRRRKEDRDRRRRRRRRKRARESDSDSDSSDSDSDSSDSSVSSAPPDRKVVVNTRLLRKLAARGETLEEREERRSRRRAERITARFGYTAEDNPFRDPNLHEPFTWNKKQVAASSDRQQKKQTNRGKSELQHETMEEIERVRRRRREREDGLVEMERVRAEESRMREQENYTAWLQKEEDFHLRQQKQRSAIRLVEGRERPIDVLAKNVLLFGGSYNNKNNNNSNIDHEKYRERYNALEEVEALEAELEEPHVFLRDLKLEELEEVLTEVRAFCRLESEAQANHPSPHHTNHTNKKEDNNSNPDNQHSVLHFWEALRVVVQDEIRRIQTGGEGGSYATVSKDVCDMFEDKSATALDKMKGEIQTKLSQGGDDNGRTEDQEYWRGVLHHLSVHTAKTDLSDMHGKMLVRQLEKLERRKDVLNEAASSSAGTTKGDTVDPTPADVNTTLTTHDRAVDAASHNNNNSSAVKSFPNGDLEEELGLSSEVALGNASYTWQEKYRPRKPRYFNRVKTGYDWNKYNQTHYDHDNPPPKIVQGYKFNVFYPDLIDKTTTPQYRLEACTDSGDFCLLRFHAGPPYEDVAFKIINREWNKARKRGFRCTFERGVLSLYFNFNSHWYRR